MSQVMEGFIELPEVRTYYRFDGAQAKPVLLLSNSLGANLGMWEPQIAEFSKQFRVLRFDTRGHGQSSVPLGPYKVEQLGRDVVALLDGLEIGQCYFCGLSMGGVIGQWLGVHASERLMRLVLCNTAAKIGTLEGWNARIELVHENGIEAAIPATLERWFTSAFRSSAPEVIARTRQMLEGTSVEGYLACCAAVRDADFREAVRDIRTKTLVVAGSHDPVTTPVDGRYLADNIPGASYGEISTAHLSNVEAADEFNAVMLEFLLADRDVRN